jgi:hypothetical protein
VKTWASARAAVAIAATTTAHPITILILIPAS